MDIQTLTGCCFECEAEEAEAAETEAEARAEAEMEEYLGDYPEEWAPIDLLEDWEREWPG